MNIPKSSFFITLAVVGAFVPAVFADATTAGLEGTLLYNSRVRSEPNTTSQTVTIFNKGEKVSIGETISGWYNITHANGTKGWMADWLVQKSAAPAVAAVEVKTVETVELGSGIYLDNSRVRKSPSLSGTIVTTYPKGTTVSLLKEENGWYNIKHANGTTGWTLGTLIKKTDRAAQNVSAEVSVPKLVDVQSTTPAGVDEQVLNQYWLDKVNALRAEKGLRQLVLDDRWKATASEYAVYMGTTGATAHQRADGTSMHKWIDAKGLPFTKRYSEGGWHTNYFTENIAWGITDGTTDGVKKVLDSTMRFFLAEAPYNGSHYRTTYHADWNSVGLGFHFKKQDNGKYRVSVVMHYGSLVQ